MGNAPTEGATLRYHGLGAANKTETKMRDQMRDTYNTEFKQVIDNLGKIDTNNDGIRETPIVTLQNNATDNAKLKWVYLKRIHN